MVKKRFTLPLILLLLFAATLPLRAEKISLKLSFNYNVIPTNDIDTWVQSYNSLWTNYAAVKEGVLTGAFDSPALNPKLDIELRIPVIYGLSLNLAGNWSSDLGEGRALFQATSGLQEEQQMLSNKLSGLTLKIGFSYIVPIPFLPKTYVFAGVGRSLSFVSFNLQDSYEAVFRNNKRDFNYWHERDDMFHTQALGTYVHFGAEYDVLKFLAVVLEFEKTWSKADGFKGDHSYIDYTEAEESGKASLYYYEVKQPALDQYYSVLTGHVTRPEDPDIANLRPGEINLNTFSFKLGIRLKF